MPRATGYSTADAQDDFLRARRTRVVSELGRRLRRQPGDVNVILPFEEVVAALGRVSEHYLGLQTVPLDSIVGTVDRTKDFDRDFRPRTARVRPRWERIAEAQRRGEAMPPISLYRIGELHFVRDGHHRVSVARALGQEVIDAYVTEVHTRVGADRAIRHSDLPTKSLERLFHERVPLAPEARARIHLDDPDQWGSLAEGVEAWGFRAIQGSGEPMDRREVARDWFEHEYAPVVEMLREADLLGRGTETEAYLRVGAARYRLLGTHEWSEEIIARLRGELEGHR
jgi:hypothetical protein